jgi:hypothetical protein
MVASNERRQAFEDSIATSFGKRQSRFGTDDSSSGVQRTPGSGPTWKSRYVRFRAAIRGIADVKRRPPIYEYTPWSEMTVRRKIITLWRIHSVPPAPL